MRCRQSPLWARARLLLELGRDQAAIEILSRALSVHPHDPTLLRLLAYGHMGTDQALESAKRLIAAAPYGDDGHYFAAIAYLRLLTAIDQKSTPSAAMSGFRQPKTSTPPMSRSETQ